MTTLRSKPVRQPILDEGLGALLTTIARPAAKPVPAAPRWRSRFFFKPIESIVEERKAQMAPKKVEPINKVLLEASNAAKASVPPKLADNIDRIRDFIVNDLSVLTLALEPASDQAREVLKMALDTEVAPEPFYRLQTMAQQAVQIRLALFLEEYLGLPKGTAADLLPKPTQTLRPPQSLPAPQEEGQGSSRELRSMRKALHQLLDQQGHSNDRPITPSFG